MNFSSSSTAWQAGHRGNRPGVALALRRPAAFEIAVGSRVSHCFHLPIRRRQTCIAASTNLEISIAVEDGLPPLKESFPVADGQELYTASLKKPLGLMLAEKDKQVIVEEVTDGSAGQSAGISVGDIVRGTTARSKNIKRENPGTVEARNKQSFLGGLILMQTDGEDFDTVMAAIMSSKCSQCDVTLVLERPKKG